MKNHHYYCLVFLKQNNNFSFHMSEFFCWTDKPKMTIDIISKVRNKADPAGDSILLSCSYLGEMTDEEFTGGRQFEKDWFVCIGEGQRMGGE